MDRAGSCSTRERAASEPVHVRLQIASKRLPLLCQLSEERFEFRRTHILSRRLEAALTVAADFEQVLQDFSFCAFGHDILPRARMTKVVADRVRNLCRQL
jgi:hypothetical protein